MQPDWIHAAPAATPLTDAAQVWRVRLAALPADSSPLEKWLAPDELQRAQTFRHAESRARHVCARAALRELLGTRLNIDPSEVRFVHTNHGKPQLQATHASNLQFNVSHSGQCVLVALAQKFAVGVDVEICRPRPEAIKLAERFFAPDESAALRQLAEPALSTAFFSLWTRKEAQLKATGDGIAGGLANTSNLPGPWTVVEFEAAPEHPAAVAIRSDAMPVTFHDLTESLVTSR
jgi:4'-phosphopantetheinyl transferase